MTNTEESESQGNKEDKERKRHKESQAEEPPRDVVKQTEAQPETDRHQPETDTWRQPGRTRRKGPKTKRGSNLGLRNITELGYNRKNTKS